MSRFRRLLTPSLKEKILTSFPYRLHRRLSLSQKNVRLSIELTTKCNLKCSMCTRHSLIQGHQLTVADTDSVILDHFYSLIKKFHQNNYQITVAPMGLGEPLLYPRLKEFITNIKSISPSIRFSLVTNGLLLNDANARMLISSSADEISISLNANNSSSYHRHMGVDAYSLVKSNIENLFKIRNLYPRSSTAIYIQYLDYEGNISAFDHDIAHWNHFMRGADKCYVHPIVNQAGFKTGKTTVKDSILYPCTTPADNLMVKKNGDVYPCCPCLYNGDATIPQLLLGNIAHDDLYSVFTDPEGKSHTIIDQMRRSDYRGLSICARCNSYRLTPNCYFRLPFGLQFRGLKWI